MSKRIEVPIVGGTLSQQVDYLTKFFPSNFKQDTRNALIGRLESTLNTNVDMQSKNYSLVAFGSSINGVGLSTDVDVTAIGKQRITSSEAMKMVCMAGVALQDSPGQYRAINIITKARVPVVKFTDVASGLPVDLTFSNGLSLRNSQLVKSYLDTQPSLRSVLLALKLWKLGNGFEKPSMYTLTLMTISYMQKHWDLPCLQQKGNGGQLANQYAASRPEISRFTKPGECVIESWDCFFEVPLPQRAKDAGQILKGLFDYYESFDWTENYVDIHHTRESQTYYQPFNPLVFRYRSMDRPGKMKMRSYMCVQDPFDLEHNTAQAVHRNDLDLFKLSWRKSNRYLANGDLYSFLSSTPENGIKLTRYR